MFNKLFYLSGLLFVTIQHLNSVKDKNLLKVYRRQSTNISCTFNIVRYGAKADGIFLNTSATALFIMLTVVL